MITHEIEMDMNNQHTRRDFILHSALIAGTGIFAGGSLNKVFGEAMESNIKMPSLKELELFDSCVTLGRFSAENCISSVEQLLSIMDRYVIKEALVQDYHARTVYPLENGNRRLLDMIRNQPRLHPVWVLEPPVQPGRKPAEKLVDNLLNSNVRVARLRLSSKGVLPWVWEDLFAALEAHRIPCFLDFGPQESTLGSLSDADVEALHIIVHKYPQLPLVLSHVMGGLGINPAAIYLVHRCKNLYLDISGILEYWRQVAYDVGPDRVLFATGMPFTDPGILVSNVQYALGLDETAKKMICGNNLRRLIRGVI
jgi:predicted TIM-barrel fold metal-dependent hydrolase